MYFIIKMSNKCLIYFRNHTLTAEFDIQSKLKLVCFLIKKEIVKKSKTMLFILKFLCILLKT